MNIYHYDRETGIFTGGSVADESPLEPGVYLIPACAAAIEPPGEVAGKVIRWNGQGWEHVEDTRGEYWNTVTGEELLVTNLEPLPKGEWTQCPRPDPESLWTGEKWEVPLNLLKERAVMEVRRISNESAERLKEGYSAAEISTWDVQASGAELLIKDEESEQICACFVRDLAAARDLSLTDMINRIIDKRTVYTRALSDVIGAQRRMEQSVAEASNEEEINALIYEHENQEQSRSNDGPVEG